MAKEKGRQWDGKSRVSNETYRQNFNRIFKNPVAKEVRTPKFKSQIIEDKTKYNRKKEKTLHPCSSVGIGLKHTSMIGFKIPVTASISPAVVFAFATSAHSGCCVQQGYDGCLSQRFFRYP